MTDKDESEAPVELNTNIPHPARVYDYLLGGKDNFPADRASAERGLAAAPEMRDTVRANRAFLVRAVRYLAEAGIARWPERIAAPGPPQNRTCDVNRIRLKQAPRDSRVVVPVTAGLRCRVGVGSGCG